MVDHQAVESIGALAAAGIDAVLLKGPAVARWLYDRADERGYGDVDLLVAPEDRAAADGVLRGLGYEPVASVAPQVPLPGGAEPHAQTWFRRRDGATVDLHRCLHHTEHVVEGDVWQEVWRDHVQLDLAGTIVAVPSARVRALHVVLHLQAKDQPGSRAWTDLERAIARVERPVWDEAAALARRWEIAAEMGSLLALVPGGAALAAELGLDTVAPRSLVQQHRRHAPSLARLELRLRGGGVRHGFQVVAAKASPAQVRRATGAGSGTASLVRAYGQRVGQLPAMVADWWRHRRRADRLR